jgi:toxin-antitoxin system PIN domain toxin
MPALAYAAFLSPATINRSPSSMREVSVPLALGTVVRVTTNPRVYRTPSMIEEAFEFCENLLGQPHCQIAEPGDRHWDIFKRLCIQTETQGARVTDAWFAALAIEWGCEWITLDRDYARFTNLKWQVPTPLHN